jgi:hypothetical protein
MNFDLARFLACSICRLEQWAQFWNRRSDPPPGFEALLTLPQEFQKRLAAGFQFLARKPGAPPG